MPKTYFYAGQNLTLKRWAVQPCCAVEYKTLYQRLRAGWPIEQALTQEAHHGYSVLRDHASDYARQETVYWADKAGVARKAIARLFGVSRQRVAQILKGRVTP